MTQQALRDALVATGLEVTVRTVQNWEAGATQPRYHDVEVVSVVLAPHLVLDKEAQNE